MPAVQVFQRYVLLCVTVYRKFSEISAALENSATIINLPNNYWGNSPTPIHPRTHFTKSRPPSKFHWYKKKTFRFPKFAIDFRLLMIVSSAHIHQKTIGAKPEVGIVFLLWSLFSGNFGHHQPTKIVIYKKRPRFARIYGSKVYLMQCMAGLDPKFLWRGQSF